MNLTFGECSDCVHRDLCIHESAMDSVRTKINNIVDSIIIYDEVDEAMYMTYCY